LVALAFPALEIGLLIKAGQAFGFWPVALTVVLTAIAGANIVRTHGLSVLPRVFAHVEAGGTPLQPMADTLLAVVGGVLLISPGLISDAVGALLQVPHVRTLLIQSGLGRLMKGAVVETRFDGRNGRWRGSEGGRRFSGGEPNGPIIDGEYERVEDDAAERRPPPTFGGQQRD